MNYEGLERVAKALKLKRVRQGSGNLVASCPFANWTHLKSDGSFGKDEKPSFGIKIDEIHESPFHCFGCEKKGTLFELISELGALRGEDYSELEEWVWQTEGAKAIVDVASKEPVTPRDRRRQRAEQEAMDVYDEDEYEPFRGSVPRYILDRGFPVEVCKAWDLGHDPEEERLMIPIRRWPDKALVGLKGRCYRKPERKSKYLPYLPFESGKFFFGEHMLNFDDPDKDPRIVIVEGELDCIKVWMAGFNCLGLMGGWPGAAHRRKLEVFDRPLITIADPDEKGQTWSRYLGDVFSDVATVYHARCPGNKDPGDMTAEEIRRAVADAKVHF